MNKKSKKILFKEFTERRLMKNSLREYNKLLRYFNITEEREEELRQFNFEMEQSYYRIRLLKEKGKIKEYTPEEIKKQLEEYKKYNKLHGTKCEFIAFEEPEKGE